MSISERAKARPREDRREVSFFVRAKVGPGNRDWAGVGVAFERRNHEPGYTLKLNTLPIDKEWNGTLVLVPPFADGEDISDDPV